MKDHLAPGLMAMPVQSEQSKLAAARKRLLKGSYADVPGTGPAGETCKTCKHIHRTEKYRKCELTRAKWTHGPGTDILASAPACSKWASPDGALTKVREE